MMDDDEQDLIAEAAEQRLQKRRAASLRGTWDAPGEFLDAAHEAADDHEA